MFASASQTLKTLVASSSFDRSAPSLNLLHALHQTYFPLYTPYLRTKSFITTSFSFKVTLIFYRSADTQYSIECLLQIFHYTFLKIMVVVGILLTIFVNRIFFYHLCHCYYSQITIGCQLPHIDIPGAILEWFKGEPLRKVEKKCNDMLFCIGLLCSTGSDCRGIC